MSVTGGTPEASGSRPGAAVMIFGPGLKPSLRFHSAGSTRTPSAFSGIAASGKRTRRPVAVSESATVKKSLGNGRRQWVGSGALAGAGAIGVDGEVALELHRLAGAAVPVPLPSLHAARRRPPPAGPPPTRAR